MANYVENLESLVTELKKKNEQLTKKLKEKHGSDKDLTVELARIRTEYADISKKYAILTEQYQKVSDERTSFKVQCDETVLNANKKIDALQKQLKESGNINEVKKEKDSQIIVLNNRISELVDENAKLRVQSKEDEVKDLKKELTEAKNELKLYKEEHSKYAELLKTKLTLETKVALLTTKLSNAKQLKDSDNSDIIKQLEEQISTLQEENEQLRKQLKVQTENEHKKFQQIQEDIRLLKEEYQKKYEEFRCKNEET